MDAHADPASAVLIAVRTTAHAPGFPLNDRDISLSFRTLGHGTVLVAGPPSVAVDPWRWSEPAGIADVVLVTSGRIDACSPDDIATAARPGAPVLCPSGVAGRLSRDLGAAVVPLRPGEAWRTAGVTVTALPAASPPRAGGFLRPGESLAYLVESGGARWLFLGASEALSAHENLHPDAAFFAVGDFSFPTPEESAAGAARVRAGLAVPTHWGDLSARFEAARRFTALCDAAGLAAVPVRGVRGFADECGDADADEFGAGLVV